MDRPLNRCCQQVPHRPDRVRDSSRHAGVFLTPVFTLTKLYHATQSATRFVILQLAAMRVRSAGVAAKVHTDSQVESFYCLAALIFAQRAR